MDRALIAFLNDAELRKHVSKTAASSFFSRFSTTQALCDDMVTKRFGGTPVPVDIQGLSSYTCYAGPSLEFVVQFRVQPSDQPSKDQMKPFTLANKIHGELVPVADFVAHVGDESEGKVPEYLDIYIMKRVPGITYLEYLLSPDYDENSLKCMQARQKFLTDVAKFFAASWVRCKRPSSYHQTQLREDFEKDLASLQDRLPASFHGVIQDCIDSLEDIMSLPSALVHPDFNSGNLMVTATGERLTGVVDWAGAEVGPFGQNLASIEFLTGALHPQKGWRRYQDYDALQSVFWTTYQSEIGGLPDVTVRIIKKARILGLLRYRGFVGPAGDRVPLKNGFASDYNMMILDACLVDPETRFDDLN